MGPGPQLSPRAISPCRSNGAGLQLLKAWPWAPPSWVHPQADVLTWPQPSPVPKEEADDQGWGYPPDAQNPGWVVGQAQAARSGLPTPGDHGNPQGAPDSCSALANCKEPCLETN